MNEMQDTGTFRDMKNETQKLHKLMQEIQENDPMIQEMPAGKDLKDRIEFMDAVCEAFEGTGYFGIHEDKGKYVYDHTLEDWPRDAKGKGLLMDSDTLTVTYISYEKKSDTEAVESRTSQYGNAASLIEHTMETEIDRLHDYIDPERDYVHNAYITDKILKDEKASPRTKARLLEQASEYSADEKHATRSVQKAQKNLKHIMDTLKAQHTEKITVTLDEEESSTQDFDM